MMKLKAFSIFLLILTSITLQAQYRLSGTIIDDELSKPIQDAEVFIKENKKLIRTTSKGGFEFENLERGNYTVIVFRAGYNTLQTNVTLNSDTELPLRLVPYSSELSEVVIAQKREETFSLNRLNPVEGTAIYAGKKSEVVLIDQLIGNLSANNARQIYSQVVGLNIYENNDAGLQLNIGGRGLDPNRTSNFNTRQNGYDISADVLGYPESYYTPPAEALSEIEVVRGAASLQYGTQFGGLINFKFKKPNPVKPMEWVSRQSVGSFNLFTSFNSISGTVGKFSYYNYYNYKRGDGFRPNSAFESFNVFAGLNYALSDRTKISLEGTYLNYLTEQPGGLTDTQFKEDYKQSNRERNWFEVDWRLISLRLEHQLNSNTDFSLNLFGLDAERNALGFRGDPQRPELNPITQVDDTNAFTRDLIQGNFRNWGAETRLLSRYKIADKDAVFLIGSKYYQSQNSSRQGPGNGSDDANFSFNNDQFPDYANQSDFEFPNLNLAVFGENIFFLTDKLSLTPGFRFEYIKTESEGTYADINYDNAGNVIFRQQTADNRIFERNIVLFGLGMSYQQNDMLELYANISQNYRSVTFSDIRVVNPTFIIDPDISDENGFTSDFGLRGKWKRHLSFDIGGFLIRYNDRIGTVLESFGANKGDRVRKNVGDALIYGSEVFVEWNAAASMFDQSSNIIISPFINMAFTRSEYLRTEESNIQGKQVEFIPDINLKTGLRLGLGNFLFSTQWTYLSEQFTDAENTPIPNPGDSREGVIGEIPAYNILDVSASYRYKWLTLEVGSNNVLDNKYFTRRAVGYPGPGIIPSDPRTFYMGLEIKL